jgi:thimet oligopeptidase
MRAADEFGKGVGVMRQLFYAAYSFYLHQQDPAQLDLKAFTADIYRRFSPYRAIEGGAVYANFGHLMGYSSMYYTYQWSLVIAKDLWTRFQREGLMSPTTVQEYARDILAPGGTEPASKLTERFLGRAYQMEAYKRWLSR